MKVQKIIHTTHNLFKYWLQGSKFPFWVILKLTYRCNSRCIYCSHREKSASKEMDLYCIKKVIDKIGNDCAVLSLSGGEPTLRKDLLPIIRYIKKKRIFLNLSTNGSDVDKIREVMPYINCLNISLDGPKEVHNKHSNIDNYDNVIRSVKIAKKMNKKVVANFVITKDNIEYVEETVDIIKQLDSGILFLNLFSSNHTKNTIKLQPDPQEEMKFLNRLMLLKKRYPNTIYNSMNSIKIELGEIKPDGNCKSGKLHFYINPEGYVFACNNNAIKKGKNILSDEILSEILNSVTYDECKKNNCFGAVNTLKFSLGNIRPYMRIAKEILIK